MSGPSGACGTPASWARRSAPRSAQEWRAARCERRCADACARTHNWHGQPHRSSSATRRALTGSAGSCRRCLAARAHCAGSGATVCTAASTCRFLTGAN
eukprot:6900305-Prymnesium_polylepis.1